MEILWVMGEQKRWEVSGVMMKADIAADGPTVSASALAPSVRLNREMSHVLPPIHSLNLSERINEGPPLCAPKRQWCALFYFYRP